MKDAHVEKAARARSGAHPLSAAPATIRGCREKTKASRASRVHKKPFTDPRAVRNSSQTTKPPSARRGLLHREREQASPTPGASLQGGDGIPGVCGSCMGAQWRASPDARHTSTTYLTTDSVARPSRVLTQFPASVTPLPFPHLENGGTVPTSLGCWESGPGLTRSW